KNRSLTAFCYNFIPISWLILTLLGAMNIMICNIFAFLIEVPVGIEKTPALIRDILLVDVVVTLALYPLKQQKTREHAERQAIYEGWKSTWNGAGSTERYFSIPAWIM
ncbi:hypothetical protein ACJX0J_040047, partial [Zea mays]